MVKEYATLQEVENEMKNRGLRDVKLCLEPGAERLPASELKEHAWLFLSAYLNGAFKPYIADSTMATKGG